MVFGHVGLHSDGVYRIHEGSWWSANASRLVRYAVSALVLSCGDLKRSDTDYPPDDACGSQPLLQYCINTISSICDTQALRRLVLSWRALPVAVQAGFDYTKNLVDSCLGWCLT